MNTSTNLGSINNMKAFLSKMNLNLTDQYVRNALIFTILVALVCVACFVVALVFMKKARVLGGIVAGLQFFGIFAAYKSVISYSKIDWTQFYAVGTGSTYEEASNNAMSKLMETYIKAAPTMIMSYVWSFVIIIVAVLTIIYLAKVSSQKGKILAILALILVIVRIFMPTVSLLGIFSTGLSVGRQVTWDFAYRFVYMLPALLVAVQALLNIKKKPAVVVSEVNE